MSYEQPDDELFHIKQFLAQLDEYWDRRNPYFAWVYERVHAASTADPGSFAASKRAVKLWLQAELTRPRISEYKLGLNGFPDAPAYVDRLVSEMAESVERL